MTHDRKKKAYAEHPTAESFGSPVEFECLLVLFDRHTPPRLIAEATQAP